MASKFKEIIQMCETRGFIKCRLQNSPKYEQISFGPLGYLLQENLKNEWLQSNLVNCDVSVFLNLNKSLHDSYNFVKQMCLEKSPFGLVQITEDTSLKEALQQENSEQTEVNKYFQLTNQIILQTFLFVSPSSSMQHFYNWQRQRRIWWRKISASPGRYSLTDIQTSPSGEQSVQILSAYPWGSHVMEQILLKSNGDSSLTNEELQVKDGRKKVQAHCIISTTYLSTMVLNTICDAYDEPLFQENKRPLLRFHRKIAPYKISFAISTSNASTSEELNELAQYLSKKLRNNYVSVLLLPSTSRNSLESQWSHYDQLGIPYCVVLNESTLKNGIAYLRSRDTTLKEQIHVSDLPDYVEKLFKNY